MIEIRLSLNPPAAAIVTNRPPPIREEVNFPSPSRPRKRAPDDSHSVSLNRTVQFESDGAWNVLALASILLHGSGEVGKMPRLAATFKNSGPGAVKLQANTVTGSVQHRRIVSRSAADARGCRPIT